MDEDIEKLFNRAESILKLVAIVKKNNNSKYTLQSSINELLHHMRIVENTLRIAVNIGGYKAKPKILYSGNPIISLDSIVKIINWVIKIYMPYKNMVLKIIKYMPAVMKKIIEYIFKLK